MGGGSASDMSDDIMHTVARIERLREPDALGKPKHTQMEVAERLGISQSEVSRLERLYIAQEAPKKIRPTPEPMTEEPDEEPDEEESEPWACRACGANDWIDPDDYVGRMGEHVDDDVIQQARQSDRICAVCGATHQ